MGRDGAEERRKGGRRADWVEMELGKGEEGGRRAEWVEMELGKGEEEGSVPRKLMEGDGRV